MKVILLKDVARIGLKGTVTDVPTGFAQNKLIPQHLAVPATPANLKRAQKLQAEAEAAMDKKDAAFEAAVAGLTNNKVTITVEANDQGHMFKAVSKEDIIEAAKAAGVDVPAAMLTIPTAIKEVGEHEILLSFNERKETATISVVAQ